MIFLSGTSVPGKDVETEACPVTVDLKFRGFATGSIVTSKKSGRELCRFFGGIPYAQPPVGPNRFLRPRELAPCYQYGTRTSPAGFTGKCNVCPQAKISDLDSEDCLQLNIYIPTGNVPAGGWPVYFYIHGGYLQFGGANEINPIAMLSETNFKAIIVMPAYRLHLYGFLASKELLDEPANTSGTVGNLGFWDQRLALQWTYTNITYFGGNNSNISIAGYSAGAHSVFYQLAYDLDYPPEKRIVKRAIMHANGPGVQPKSLEEAQEHFDELLNVLRISQSLPAAEKLRLLRETSPQVLRKAINKMKLHQFRAITDGHFVKTSLFKELEDGIFAKKMLASNVKLFIGESANEHFAYATHWTPKNSAEALYTRLCADYPTWIVDVLQEKYFKDGSLPKGVRSYKELFGRIYADMQVHISQRALVDALARFGAEHLVYRYRIDWRSEITWSQKIHGATHWSDNVLWFFGDGKVLPEKEQKVVQAAFLNQYAKFVNGEELAWGTSSPLYARRLKSDGTVDIWYDVLWQEKGRLWQALSKARPKLEATGTRARL